MTDDSTAKGEATEPEEMELTRQEIRIRDLAVKILVARIAHCVATDGEYDVHGEAREAYEDALEASEEFDKRTRLRRRFCALSRTNRGDNALQRGMGGSMTDDYRPEDVGELSPREKERRSLAITIMMARYNEHLADKETEHPWWGSFGERGLDAYEPAPKTNHGSTVYMWAADYAGALAEYAFAKASCSAAKEDIAKDQANSARRTLVYAIMSMEEALVRIDDRRNVERRELAKRMMVSWWPLADTAPGETIRRHAKLAIRCAGDTLEAFDAVEKAEMEEGKRDGQKDG